MADYLLIHGAMTGAWSWHRLVPLLEAAQGVGQVVAFDLPGHGSRRRINLAYVTLQDYVQAAIDEIESRQLQQVILVAHSLGGMVVPGIVARAPERIKRVVFIAAVVPRDGKSILDLWPSPRWARWLYLLATHARTRGVLPPRWYARRRLSPAMGPELRQGFLEQRCPEPYRPLEEPISMNGFSTPSTYIFLTDDGGLPPARQRKMIMNLNNPQLVTIESGHNVQLTWPEEAARAILDCS